MRRLFAAALLSLSLLPAGPSIGLGGAPARPTPAGPQNARPAAAPAAATGSDPYLGLSIDELRSRLGAPEAIAGYESFSWFSASKAFPPDQWEAARGKYMARADVYSRKAAGNTLKYEFLLRPDIRQSREHPTLRVTDYSVTFEKPVRLRDLPAVFAELKAVSREPAIAYEGRSSFRYNRNSLVVQRASEAAGAIANGFWEEPDEPGPSEVPPYGPKYQFWFAGGLGLYAAAGDSLVERVTVGVAPTGKFAKDDRTWPGEVRELPTLGAFFAK